MHVHVWNKKQWHHMIYTMATIIIDDEDEYEYEHDEKDEDNDDDD